MAGSALSQCRSDITTGGVIVWHIACLNNGSRHPQVANSNSGGPTQAAKYLPQTLAACHFGLQNVHSSCMTYTGVARGDNLLIVHAGHVKCVAHWADSLVSNPLAATSKTARVVDYVPLCWPQRLLFGRTSCGASGPWGSQCLRQRH